MVHIPSCASVLWLVLIVLPSLVAAQDSRAASPTTRLIPYSAVLLDRDPDAIAGGRTLTFALFDEAEAARGSGARRRW